jgi:SNF2 family DNA or RNA helicase
VLDALVFDGALFEKLYAHQRAGIAWLWQLHLKQHGGILGDDMGMGKTVQIGAFLGAAFDAGVIDRALVVLPASLLNNWQRELAVWCPKTPVVLFHGSSKGKRERDLAGLQSDGGICLTTYGMVSSCTEQLAAVQWDYVVLDEGHTIKNPTKQVTMACRELKAPHRILMTGTPIINSLKELWVLFDWACQSALLGADYKAFKRTFEDPIVTGNMQNATDATKRVGAEISLKLRQVIAPHFLRREKSLIHSTASAAPPLPPQAASAAAAAAAETPANQTLQCRKNDFVVWMPLTVRQKELYRAIVGRYNALGDKSRIPLPAISLLKKVCDTPALLDNSMKLCDGLDLTKWAADALEREAAKAPAGAAASDVDLGAFTIDADGVLDLTGAAPTPSSGAADFEQHLAWSIKFQFVRSLLRHFRTLDAADTPAPQRQRTLLFSRSTRVLDIVQALVERDGHRCVRIDGSVPVNERARRIDAFQSSAAPHDVMLLTSQVGGVGLTLTAANRVVILDPSWTNIDNQAVDRVYRIGQRRDVVVYRLITVGTVEEKIYRRQVFKQCLLKSTTEKENQYRYFGEVELKQLFTVADDFETGVSTTQQQLHAQHARERVTDASLDRHIAWLHEQRIAGLSDHDLLFSTAQSASANRELDDEARLQAATAWLQLHTPTKPAAKARRSKKQTDSAAKKPHWLAPDAAAAAAAGRSDVDQVTDMLQRTLNFDGVLDLTQDGDGDDVQADEAEAESSAHVCDSHRLQQFRVQRCSCHVTREDSLKYTARLAEAERIMQVGDWRGQAPVARNLLGKLLDALDLCDENAELHGACIALSRHLRIAK